MYKVFNVINVFICFCILHILWQLEVVVLVLADYPNHISLLILASHRQLKEYVLLLVVGPGVKWVLDENQILN